jgi:hypothetical protein
LFAASAHNPAFAKKVGVPVALAKEINQLDAGTGILKGPLRRKRQRAPDRAPASGPMVAFTQPGNGG